MNIEELNKLTLPDICYILLNEKDCYSPNEIMLLEQRKKELSRIIEEKEYREIVKNRPKEIICPKCDGVNKSENDTCDFCGYKFKDKDYTNKNEEDEKTSNTILFIISFLMPIIGIILGIIYIAKDEEDFGKKILLFSIIISIIFFLIGMFILK